MCPPDLSFNSIEKIEGLESLQKLELLNLSNNNISVIENMDALEKLTHFCIANNLLGQLDNVTNFTCINLSVMYNILHLYCEYCATFVFFAEYNITECLHHLMETECFSKVLYLRKFKNLFTLNLFGNPASKEDDYKFFIAAYFPNLMCLDYRLLDKQTVSTDSGVFCNLLHSHTFCIVLPLSNCYSSFSFKP